MDSEPDYITVNPAVHEGYYNVVIMRWDKIEDGYRVWKISTPLNAISAGRLALSWSMAMGKLEIR